MEVNNNNRVAIKDAIDLLKVFEAQCTWMMTCWVIFVDCAKRRRNVSGSKRNRGINNGTAKPKKKKVNIPVPEGHTKQARDASSSQAFTEVVQTTQTVTVDAHINLEKTTGNGSSHKINFNAKSVEEEAAHHKSLTNSCEHAIKNIQTSVNLSTNSCGGRLDKKV
ncbi:Uncharacterized protein Fot_03985 [Forsythia ovata]|uniref:Uncharacterized protein n=1 Tax=Forsythia ovata TaxID=205694 RepID=A0ABD1XB99_9LAMI